MSLLSDNDIGRMQTVAEMALPDTCVVQSQTFASDNGGGGSLTLTASGTFDCRLAPLMTSGQEEEIGDRLTAESDHIVTLPSIASVSTEKQLVINGGTYNVTAIRDRSWEITQRVEVSRYT